MTPHILVSLRGYAALQSQLQAERQFKADALEKQCRAESQNAELVELGDKLREQIGFGLVTALRAQRQIDNDGCEVGVSRQACDEAAEFLESFAALSKVQS